MSTIASPRDSISARSPASSVRTSLDTTRPARRNRAALRDYYNLKNNPEAKDSAGNTIIPEEDGTGLGIGYGELESELDREGFDADSYVRQILANQGLESVLKVEAGLVSEILNLDGEKKALVYDNYSKLIAATNTIRSMRTNMDPLTPATATLFPTISHIAETALSLSTALNDRTPPAPRISSRRNSGSEKSNANAKQTVRWVLDSPRRFEALLEEGRRAEAEEEWREVKGLLEKWKGVKGAEEVWKACEEVLEESDEEDEDE